MGADETIVENENSRGCVGWEENKTDAWPVEYEYLKVQAD